MNTDELDKQTQNTAQAGQEENPLLFWAAYMVGTDDKKHYLGNGKGGIRLFKQKDGPDGIETFLDQAVDPKHREKVVVHQVQGNIVVPVEADQLEPSPPLPAIPNIFERLPIPISTLYPNTLPPSPIDQLREYEDKQKRKRRRK